MRSSARQYFKGQHHGNLTKRISELHERTVNSTKRSQCHLFLRRM